MKQLIITMNSRKRCSAYIKKHYTDLYNTLISSNVRDFSFSQLLYNYCYDIIEIPRCKICSSELLFKNFEKGYNKYCNKICAMNDTELIELRNKKSKDTCLNKYGVDSYAKTEEFKQKSKESIIKKYGVDSYAKTEEFKQNMLEHNKQKYGVDFYFQTNDFKDKVREYSITNFGLPHYNISEDVVSKKRKTCLEKYGNEQPLKTTEVRNKIIQTNLNRYNNTSHMTTKKEQGLLTDFYANIIKKHYSKYENENLTINSISGDTINLFDNRCNHTFDINKQLLYLRSRDNKQVCTICNSTTGKNTSYLETDLFEYIKNNYEYSIILNSKYIIPPYELDIYIPDIKIAFEFNGLRWHSDLYKDIDYHMNKNILCDKKGITLYHVYEDDWVNKQNIIKSNILFTLKQHININKNNIEIKPITDIESCIIFLEENDINGFIESTHNIGYFEGDELVSILSVSENENIYNIDRLCNKNEYNNVEYFNRLVEYFILNYKPLKLKFKVDRGWNLYSNCNFIKKYKHSKPKGFGVINKSRIYLHETCDIKIYNSGYITYFII